ncbi:hypothetical protein LSAT2_027545 [Lamellibrachia satsuma]|nr:hypothetical protein LSAT2_027545 [Lamellibrachia satsuma]
MVIPHVRIDAMAMASYSHDYEDVGKNNKCRHLNGGCEHICVPIPRGRRCACWDGFNVVNETKCFITTHTCPLEYNATRGRIQNPGYPGYQNNTRCQIIVHLQKPGQVIFLKVEEFDLGNNHDFLQIESQRWSGSLPSGHNYTVTHCNSSSPCRNGGTCVNSSFCVCPANRKGDRCELVDDDQCRSLPCQNGGQCKSLSSGYTCDCRPHTTGRQCETGHVCYKLPVLQLVPVSPTIYNLLFR